MKVIAPLAVLLAGSVGAAAILATRPEVETRAPARIEPYVRVVAAQARPVRLSVTAYGTVEPHTESDLVAEVAGRVVWISPALRSGGFFDRDEALIRLDRRDHEIALQRAQATLKQRRTELALARSNRERNRSLSRGGIVSEATRDEVETAAVVAEAAVAEAEAAVARAKLDLERTEIRAPYSGRVRSEDVDVGQFVTVGRVLARIYATDYVEISLPVGDEELAYLDVPLGARDGAFSGPEVHVRAELAGRRRQWSGRIVRTGGEIDPKSRMIRLVARVDDPYGNETAQGNSWAPLPVGLFVEAEIVGREEGEIVSLPAVALRGEDEVLVVDGDHRLRFRRVEVLRRTARDVLIRSGLVEGERVCVSVLDAISDGMKVKTFEDADSGSAPAAASS